MQFNFTSIFKFFYPGHRTVETLIIGAMAMVMLACSAAMAEEPVPEAASASSSAASIAGMAPGPVTGVFATVGDMTLLVREFNLEFMRIQRERYWHAKVQEHKIAEFQREVRDNLIERALVAQEVTRRADAVDEEELNSRVEQNMGAFDQRFAEDEEYQKDRKTFEAGIRAMITRSMRIRDIEKKIRDSVTDPGDEILKQYYQENLELFTQPGQYRISVILLGVDPSAGVQAVMETSEEAKGLVEALRAGNADFAELAEAISADKSAMNGGDMGYQHSGMLAPAVEVVLNELSEGEISDPVRVLEGVSIFRLDEKVLPNVQSFDTVRERVLGLWLRENKDKTWKDFVSSLRAGVKIVVNDDFFVPLPEVEAEDKES